MKIVSACLAGVRCNWQGEAKPCAKVIELVAAGKAIPICPEQLGGMPTPRDPAERSGNRVISISGEDVTDKFKHGTEEGLKIAKLINCKEAILKARSPSCGVGKIYDGTFTKNLTPGDGVFAKMLKEHRIRVQSEEEL
ncbi:MAG: hypothetical protein ACD_21C00047G0001 [uncultured bacterium]|nr:MAG: hypothetical protein ACD_21C00047G0001 [uncultured bacterium]